ncbi:MAG: hypothetical protein WC187_03530 [Bacillota bacterium]
MAITVKRAGDIKSQQVETCVGVGYQPLSVCVPVTVSPFAIEGTSTTFCCGDPVVTPGPAVCEGVEDGICEFTMTQDLCVRVPVTFGATSLVGSTFVQCGDATDEDVCTGCGDVNSQ